MIDVDAVAYENDLQAWELLYESRQAEEEAYIESMLLAQEQELYTEYVRSEQEDGVPPEMILSMEEWQDTQLPEDPE